MSLPPIDITPEDSVVPIFLEQKVIPPPEEPDFETEELLRQSGIEKLVSLGLTEEEALALIGR